MALDYLKKITILNKVNNHTMTTVKHFYGSQPEDKKKKNSKQSVRLVLIQYVFMSVFPVTLGFGHSCKRCRLSQVKPFAEFEPQTFTICPRL